VPDWRKHEHRDFIAPRTTVEGTLAGIWADVLGIERVGIHDNFFDLGGHSLLATQIMSRLRDALQVDLPLHTLFDSPTVAGMAAFIAEKQQSKEATELQLGQTVAELEQMTDEDVQRLLVEEGREIGESQQ
jgi:acyl carrier protein